MPIESPQVDVDGFMSSANIGIEGIRAGLEHKRDQTREAKVRCSYCGKEDTAKKPLQGCTRCREARYCDRECQTAHYKSQHKHDCVTFKEPPLTRAWNMKTILPGCKYPERPNFAQAYNDGMGCWITISGSITCSLYTTAGDRTEPPSHKGESPSDLLRNMPGFPGTFLDISILVQNRRKAEEIVTVGKAFLAVITKTGKSTFLQGKTEKDIIQDTPHPKGGIVPAITPSYVHMTSFNGKPIKKSKTSAIEYKASPALKDNLFCAVHLKPGDFAIFDVQYRIGGPNVTMDFEALALIDHILVPSVPYDPDFSGPYKDLLPRSARKNEVCELRAFINQRAVDEWYDDYRRKGERAHIASHYGETRAEMSEAGDAIMGQMLSQLAAHCMERMPPGM